ncbi:uncharacterized protein TM35_000013410 [Trypanosoma theileri]|uniref:Uncharacterized protein n=1 Tax=Trypanosoma theileri TaxID=67003 RepID=A0A1X0P953_9TRYP|nr:uncharacterized protein TM35_000013410 [Trypanosoma theileri]ORC93464.1 hypothetical protein TM35_000013410 [Trypanosoma theileri]
MSSKEEVAELMAHGDAETKISLLKKAVVSVTKQKQLLEVHNKQLQDQMVAIGEELSHVQEENKTLTRKLKKVEAELETERKRGHFGASVKTTWKGISSFVTGADGESQSSSSGAKGSKSTAIPMNLSAEDQEKIISENEHIHMQLFDLKTKYEDEQRKWMTENERLTSELSVFQAEVAELRSLLDSTAHACDHWSVECTRQAAMAQFCHHFFVLAWDIDKQRKKQKEEEKGKGQEEEKRLCVVISPYLMRNRGGVPPQEIREELAIGTLNNVSSFLRTLMSGVSVLVASLRDSFGPHVKGATLSDIRCYRDRLSALLEAHGTKKATLLFHVKQMEDSFTASVTPDEKLMHMLQTQTILFSSLDEWLVLMCEHIRLLVDASVSTGNNITSNSSNNENNDVINHKQTFIESTISAAIYAVASIRGSLTAVNQLCSDSHELLRRERCDSAEWLLALERFWWEGCSASTSLQQAIATFTQLVQDLLTTITSDPIRTALQFICKSLGSLTTHTKKDKLKEVSSQERAVILSPVEIFASEGLGSADNKELVDTLAAADRAAICFHTQMNLTLLELAEKQEALINAQQEVQRLEYLNRQKTDDAERMREALEEQIRLLSEQLVMYTESSTINSR